MAEHRLDGDQHVVRHCRNRQLIRNDQGEVVGVFPDAFALRPMETYLSAVWLECMDGDLSARIQWAHACLSTGLKIRGKDGLGVLSVGRAVAAGVARSAKIKIRHEPGVLNPSYATIRGLPREDDELRQLLAAQAIVSVHEVQSLVARS